MEFKNLSLGNEYKFEIEPKLSSYLEANKGISNTVIISA